MPNKFCIGVVLLVVLAGCSVRRGYLVERQYLSFTPSRWPPSDSFKAVDSLLIGYTGCGGFTIEFHGEILMLDPYFSNRKAISCKPSNVLPDTQAIAAYLRRLKSPGKGSVRTILLSHAHYDHLADVPALIADYLEPGSVKIYGSETAENLLRAFKEPAFHADTQFVNLERFFRSDTAMTGQISPFFYTPGRRIRFAAVRSEHAGHFCFLGPHKIPFVGGEVKKVPRRPPSHITDFKEGQNFNYLIDLLDEHGRPIYRIFSNAGAACSAGVGFPPQTALNDRKTDLLLICGANYNVAENYPLPLLEYLHPDILFVGHWENFFRNVNRLYKKPAVVFGTNIPRLMRQLKIFQKQAGYPGLIIMDQPQCKLITIRF